MASAVPLRDQRAAAAKSEAYRHAHELTRHLAELLRQLEVQPDPGEATQLHESARLAVGTIVRLLAGAGTVAGVLPALTDLAQLDAWVQLLDELLTEAQTGHDGAGDEALALAASVAAGVDRIAGVEAR